MRAYIIRRLLLMIPTLFIVTLVVFFSMRMIPGSVLDLMVMEHAEEGGLTPEVRRSTWTPFAKNWGWIVRCTFNTWNGSGKC